MTRTFMVSPCGTSVFENYCRNNRMDDWNRLRTYTNKGKEQISDDVKSILESLKKEVSDHLQGSSIKDVSTLSAELNGILKYYGNRIDQGRNDKHCLVSTDTAIGNASAKVIEEWLKSKNLEAYVLSIPGLQTEDYDRFLEASSKLTLELIERIRKRKSDYGDEKKARRESARVVFNLTGGFKALTSVLSIVGVLYADEIIYVFERSEKIMRIPRLPVGIKIRKEVEDHFNDLRRVEKRFPAQNPSALPETLVARRGEATFLLPWTVPEFNKLKEEKYPKELQEPLLPDLLEYARTFTRDFKKLEKTKKKSLNERLDELAVYLADRSNPPPAPLGFKEIKGKKGEFEFRPYEEGDRAYGHFEGMKFVVDRIGTHL